MNDSKPLTYVIRPRFDSDGACRRFELRRPDLGRLEPADLQQIRQAFGLNPLEPEEVYTSGETLAWWNGES